MSAATFADCIKQGLVYSFKWHTWGLGLVGMT